MKIVGLIHLDLLCWRIYNSTASFDIQIKLQEVLMEFGGDRMTIF